MTPFRTVGGRLSFASLLLVAGALAIVYLIVVPSLRRSLVDDRLDELEQNAHAVAIQIAGQPRAEWPFTVLASAPLMNARVTVLEFEVPDSVQPLADSGRFRDIVDDPAALQAARTFRVVRATVERSDRSYAEVAVPLTAEGPVILLSADLSDRLANIKVVEHRLSIAALIAIAISMLVGYLAARVFARRIRRLERAVDRLARGEFDEPVVDQAADELGRLAEAVDRMRRQLAGLDRARGEFIANASHELRTPLFSLSGFLELLSDEELDEETRREFVQTMREQVSRLTRLATDLLDLSRLDAGEVRLDSAELDLSVLSEALVAEFGPVAQLEGKHLEAEPDGEVAAIGDEERVLQIGRLLIENAIRHTPPGTRIAVRAGSDGIAGRLSVENDGPEIPLEHARQIFERFYRVEGSRASGSGLGLAIAKELAELMGGRIQLDSGPGKTMFSLVLPAPAGARQQAPVFT